MPVMVMEFAVGRASQRSIAKSFQVLEPKGSKWHIYSWFGIAGNYLLMMFYTTVAGWLLLYCVKMLRGGEDDEPRHKGHKGIQQRDPDGLPGKAVLLADVAAEDGQGADAQGEGEEGLAHAGLLRLWGHPGPGAIPDLRHPAQRL